MFSVINNFNENWIFVAYKQLQIFPRNISDSYHVFKLIIIYTTNIQHKVLKLIIRYKILSCVIWKLLLWIKKKTFSGRIIFTHIHLSNDNRRLRCLRIISTGLRSLSFQSIQCTHQQQQIFFARYQFDIISMGNWWS